jgi:hypothetical protein
MRPPLLTDTDHRKMDRMLERVLDAYKAGTVSRDQVTGGLAQIMAALDKGNVSEAVNWFNQEGVTLFDNSI